jgi:Mu-like prophage major head subunit gpT
MPTTTGGFAALLAPGLFDVLFNEIDHQPNQWVPIFNIYDSVRQYEEELKIAGLGAMVAKPEGTAVTFDDPLISGKVRYTHSSYGLGFRVTREMYDDDLYDVMNEMSAELGRAAAYKVEIDAWSVLNNAFSTSFTGIDGLSLCHTAHTRLDGGATIANRPSTDADFSFTSYQAALDAFNTMVDDRGRPLVLVPSLLICDPTFMWAAKEVLGSEYKPYTANNEINPLNMEGVDYLASRYLTNSRSWFLLCPPKQQRKGGHDMKFFWRTRPETSDADEFQTGDAMFKIFARYSKGFSEFRGVYGSSGG